MRRRDAGSGGVAGEPDRNTDGPRAVQSGSCSTWTAPTRGGVALTFHVGSAHEVEGRTGFAHLFEHLFFLDSENLGPGGLDRS
jgi:hypothetical protein